MEATPQWKKDDVTGEHQLIVPGLKGFYVVMRSAAGDWYAGFQSDDAPSCDEIEYFGTWQRARAWCINDLTDRRAALAKAAP